MGQCLYGDGRCCSYVHLTDVAGARATTIGRLNDICDSVPVPKDISSKTGHRKSHKHKVFRHTGWGETTSGDITVWLCSDKKES